MPSPNLRVVRRSRRQALTAASQIVNDPDTVFKSTLGYATTSTDWQDDAWDLLDQVGELRYYVSWRAASCSRVRLVASDIDEDTGLPTGATENQRVSDIVNQVAGGALGQSQFVRRSVECLTIPGEFWAAIIATVDRGMRWLVLTREEIHRNGRGVEVDLPEGGRHELNMGTDAMFRVWNPRPRRASEPDSPVRSTLDSLHEIVRTTKTISNASKSRLIGNGVVFVPQEMSLPPINAPTAQGLSAPLLEGTPAVQQLQELLWQVANTAYDDEDSMAALIPMFATVPGDQIKNVSHLKWDNDVTELAVKVRNDAISRLAMGLDVSPERLLGLGNSNGVNHWCKDAGTEVLTRSGWRTHDLLNIGDEVLTLNHDTGLSEWQPVLDIYRADVTDEPMLSMESGAHSSLSTAEHRWPVFDIVTGLRGWRTSRGGFKNRDRIPTAAPCASLPQEPKYSDEFVQLVAAYTSDGSRLHYESGTEYVRICKFDAQEIVELRRLCRAVFGRAVSEYHHPTRTRNGVAFVLHADESRSLFDVTADYKAVTPQFIHALTEAQLHLFLDAMIDVGDGVVVRGGGRMFYQVEPSRLDAIEMAAVLAGYRVTRGRRNQQTGFGDRLLYWVRVTSKRKSIMPASTRQTWTTYTGTIWCPRTENRTWFARRNGYVYATGNTAWQLADEDVNLHISPVMETICQALNDSVIKTVLEREGIDPTKYMLWYDASELTADPDKTDNATAAFDRGAITAEAYRDYLGLGDESGYDYTTLEGWQQWAQDHVSAKPELMGSLAPLLGPVSEAFPELSQNYVAPLPELEQPEPPETTEAEPETEGEEPAAGPVAASMSPARAAVVDLMVSRALELAGKRRRTRADHNRLRDVPVHQTHRFMPPVDPADIPKLIDGWDAALEDEVIARLGFDADDLKAEVRRAVRKRLTAQVVDV